MFDATSMSILFYSSLRQMKEKFRIYIGQNLRLRAQDSVVKIALY